MSSQSLKAAIMAVYDKPFIDQMPSRMALVPIALRALTPYPAIHRRAEEMARLLEAYANGAALDPLRFQEMVDARWPELGKTFSHSLAEGYSASYLSDLISFAGYEVFVDAGKISEASPNIAHFDVESPQAWSDWLDTYFEALKEAGLI